MQCIVFFFWKGKRLRLSVLIDQTDLIEFLHKYSACSSVINLNVNNTKKGTLELCREEFFFYGNDMHLCVISSGIFQCLI